MGRVAVIAIFLLVSMSNGAFASGFYCSGEKVTAVGTDIPASLGEMRVFFVTDKSCQNACVIPSTYPIEVRQAAQSTLLTALATGKTITTLFLEATTPCQLVPSNATPIVLTLNQ